jgi:hypothetical protein
MPTIPIDVDDPVIELAERAITAWNDWAAALAATTPYEEKMMAWRRENPMPLGYPIHRPLPRNVADTVDDPLSGVRSYNVMPLSADDWVAAKRAARNWRRRERGAEKRTGYAAAMAAQEAADAVSTDLVEELRNAIPVTFAGLAAKARASTACSNAGCCDFEAELARDIRVLAGELTRAEAEA